MVERKCTVKSRKCGNACRAFHQRCKVPGYEYEPPEDLVRERQERGSSRQKSSEGGVIYTTHGSIRGVQLPGAGWFPIDPSTGRAPGPIQDIIDGYKRVGRTGTGRTGTGPNCNPKRSYRCGNACRGFSQSCKVPGYEYEPPAHLRKSKGRTGSKNVSFDPKLMDVVVQLGKQRDAAKNGDAKWGSNKSPAEATAEAQFNFAFEAMKQNMSVEQAELAVAELQRQIRRDRRCQPKPDSINSGVI